MFVFTLAASRPPPRLMTHKILNRDPKDVILKAFRLFDYDSDAASF